MLCRAAGFGDATHEVLDAFRRLVSPWADVPIGRIPTPWVSDISDDNTPIEFSVAIAEGRSDVRVLFEPQGREPTLSSYRLAGLELQERLQLDFGVDGRRFSAVQDLFLPEDMGGPFAVWSSVVFAAGRAPTFKAYFNPQARGVGRASALVEEALQRLGLPRAWAALSATAARRGPWLDEIKYFALDLTPESDARVKVYVRHHEASPEDLEIACSGATSYVPGEALSFGRAMRGGGDRMSARATFTCSAFVAGKDLPTATTLYIPICAYAKDDAVARRRVDDYLAEHVIDARPYDSIIDGYANRPLEAGVGMQSWVALRHDRSGARLTVYLATEATRVFPPGTVPAATRRTAFASAEDVIRHVRRYPLSDHPFVRRLRRESDAAGALWLMIRSTYEGTSRQFVRWLATVTARVEDDRVRSLLAHQLDEELGQGDVSRAHARLMERFLEAIAPMRPAGFTDGQLAGGRRLAERLEQHYMSDDPLEGLAALMAGEVCAEQLIGAVAEILPLQRFTFDPAMIEWLTRHDEIEGEHADESSVLAGLVPADAASVASIARGALGVHQALWESLDALYVACFGARTLTRARLVPASGSVGAPP